MLGFLYSRFSLCLFSKILTTVVSTFTSYYVHLWSNFFADKPLSPPMPSFDGRVVLYPSPSSLRDYMNWRQVDCTLYAVRRGENEAQILRRSYKQPLQYYVLGFGAKGRHGRYASRGEAESILPQ